jgi:hypothetical protein
MHQDGFAAIHYAARGGSVDVLDLLLTRGEDVNQLDNVSICTRYMLFDFIIILFGFS